MNILKAVSMSAYYQIRRISKAFKNWKKFGVIMFGSLFLASNVAALPTMAAVENTATYRVYIDTNVSSPMTVGQSRTFTAQAVMGASNDVTASSKFNWFAVDKASGQIVDTKNLVGSTYVFSPTVAGDYQIRARGFLNGDASKNAWETFPAFVKVNAAGGSTDNGTGTGGDTTNNGGTDNSAATYRVYVDTNLSNAMNVGDSRIYNAQAILGPDDVTGNSKFNWFAVNTDTSAIVDTKQNVGSSYTFNATAPGHYQIRARGYLNGDASKNAWETFPVFVTVNGTTVTCGAMTITMDPSTNPLSLANGVASTQLTAHIYDSEGNAVTPTNLQWVVVNGGATVTKTGDTTANFTTSLAGSFTVRATGFACGSPVIATKVIEVVNSSLALSVMITPDMPRVLAGLPVTYTAQLYNNGLPFNPSNNVTYTWSLEGVGPSIGHLLSSTGKDVVFQTNTGLNAKYYNFLRVTASYLGQNPTDTEGADIYQVGTQQVIDHVIMTIDRNPINTNDSTLVRAQAYDQSSKEIANCSYNWSKLSGVGSIISATNLQVITFGSQNVIGTADLQVTANCFGADRSTTGTVQVVGNTNNFRVELTPDPGYVAPNSDITFTARGYSNNGEVTGSTGFSFSMLNSNAGYILSQNANMVTVHTGNNLGTFGSAIQTTGYYQSMSATDAATIIVQQNTPIYTINGSIVGVLDGRGTAGVCTDDVITYTVTLSNFQNTLLTNVSGKMEIPANTTFVSATSPAGSIEVFGNGLKWTIGTLGYSQSQVMTVKVMPKVGLTGNRTINASFNAVADQANNVFNANPINLVCGGVDGKGPLPSTGVEWQMLVALLAGALGLTTVTYLLLRRKDMAVERI